MVIPYLRLYIAMGSTLLQIDRKSIAWLCIQDCFFMATTCTIWYCRCIKTRRFFRSSHRDPGGCTWYPRFPIRYHYRRNKSRILSNHFSRHAHWLCMWWALWKWSMGQNVEIHDWSSATQSPVFPITISHTSIHLLHSTPHWHLYPLFHP